ncbi:MAG: hypothetical protein MUO54_00415 [Anaerolineales bacterium]|nr:hypothetical protein [Anaerolineales bacterium]
MIDQKQGKSLKWLARVSGVVLSSIWIYYFIRYISDVGFKSLRTQTSVGIILFLLISTLSVGVGIAWRNPLSGGKFIVVQSVMLSIFNYFTAENNHIIAVLFQGFPYFLVGIFFIQSHLAKKENT